MFVSAATVWPLQAARAQQSENPARIGFLPLGSPSNQHDLSYVEAFRKGLIENGLIEGRNIILDVVWVANDSEYDQAAIELVRRGATVLVPVASSASAACKRQTSTIPIVFINVGNPVGIGIVESLSHPGGNVTGFADLTVELSGKLLEFARELTPARKPICYLWYDKWVDGQSRLLATEQAAKASGMALQARAISDVVELNSAVADLKSNGIKAVILQPGGFT
jgi:putative ABC transport system substrate-binding protein